MIGKPQWFKYRIFGWGIAPKTWQGWVYIGVWIILLIGSALLLKTSVAAPWIFGTLIALLVFDTLHIMMQLYKTSDERENYHQLIIERNCSFAAIAALIGVALYQSYQRAALVAANPGMMPFDISIAIILGVMLITKIVTTAYVKWKM